MRNRKAAVFILCATLLCLKAMPAQGEAGAPGHKAGVEWARMLSHEDWSDERPGLIRSDDGGTYVVGRVSRRLEKRKYHFKLCIWKLDARGKQEWTRMPEIPGIKKEERIVWSRVYCLPDERMMLAQESLPRSGAWLMRFDESGRVTSARKLAFSSRMGRFRGIRKVKGGMLAFGSKSGSDSDAWVARMDMQGNELWQKTYDNGATEWACALSAAPDGSFVMACDSGKYNKFGGGESRVWVVKCDARGNRLSQASFKGRHPNITGLKNGAYMLFFNAADFPQTRSQVMGIDAQLKRTWEPVTLYEGPGLGMYKLDTDLAGHVIVAGAAMGGVRLWKISPRGKPVWSIRVKKQVSVAIINSLVVNKHEYLLAGAGRDTSMKKRHVPDAHNDLSDIFIARVREE